MAAFYIKFFVTNILFSVIISGVLIRLSGLGGSAGNSKRYSVWELLLYSLGLGPMVTVLLLYYFILLFPSHRVAFYLPVIFGFYLLLGFLGRKGFVLIWQRTGLFLKELAGKWKAGNIVYWAIVALLLFTFLFVYTGTVEHNRIEGHDALIYGNYGKMYLKMRKIIYSKEMQPAYNGFVFKGSPKPAFSLLLTWEYMLNGRELSKTRYFDAYFRSTSGYYGLLIIMAAFLWLFRQNRWLALVGTGMLLSSLSFFLMLIDFHLDSFRIFFLMIAWIWLAYAIKEKTEKKEVNYFPIIMLGLFSGFAAFAHVIGLIAVAIIGFVFSIYYPAKIMQRIKLSIIFFIIVIAFGGIHYILEILYGSVSGFINYIL